MIALAPVALPRSRFTRFPSLLQNARTKLPFDRGSLLDRSAPQSPRRLALALALAIACATRSAFPPSGASVEPIAVPPGSTRTIQFRGVAYVIESGTHVGDVHLRLRTKPIQQLRWSGPTNPLEFNSIAERCLAEAGYDVARSHERLTTGGRTPSGALLLGVVVTSIWTDTYVSSSFREKDYEDATLEGRVRVLEQTGKVLYDRVFTGRGRHQGMQPMAIPAAFENLLDHALADADFVETVRSR